MKSFLLGSVCTLLMFSTAAVAGLSDALTAFNIKRYDQALSEFSYLSDEGDPIASFYLGKMYAEGLGVEKDKQRAIEYYQKSDDAYNIDASYELAEILLKDAKDREDENFLMGLKYLKRSAYAGQADALTQLGEFYEKGEWVDKDLKSAFGFYLMGALKGNARSQYYVARLYFAGKGVTQDYENGLKWLTRSARQGYVLAQKDLAIARLSEPAILNPAEAYIWLSIISAYNSDDIGEWAISKRNEIEKKIKKREVLISSQRKAREWRPVPPEKSVPSSDILITPTPIIPGFNDPEAVQAMLAQGEVLLTDGSKHGITQEMILKANITKDLTPIEKAVQNAINKGNNEVYAYYGDLLRSRFQNDTGAVEWYRKGAEVGNAYAQYQLAKAYCEGKGVDAARPSQCYAWLSIAQENSQDTLKLTIKNALEIVISEMTQEELKQGEDLINEYKTKNIKPSKTEQILNFL